MGACRASSGSSQLFSRPCLLVHRGGAWGASGTGEDVVATQGRGGCASATGGEAILTMARYREQWETLRVRTRCPGECFFLAGN